MKAEFDSNRDADLYRLDGRSYEISEENDVLTLQLRRSIRLERSIVAVLLTVLLLTFYLFCAWKDRANWHNQVVFYTIAILQPAQLGMGFVMQMKRGELWTFDKGAAEVRCNTLKVTEFPKIRGVRAWRRGSRFYISLQLRYGQTRKFGRLAFSRSEYAWRQDAAQIVAFLNVPLEIPPV